MGLRDMFKPRSSELARAEAALDTWTNLLTAMGKAGVDKRTGVTFIARQRLDQATLEDLFCQDDLSRKIVARWPEEMVREWVDLQVEGDTDATDDLIDEFDRLEVRAKYEEAENWARLYGGALLVLGAEDGQPFDQPLREQRIASFEYLQVVDRWDATPMGLDIEPGSPRFGEPAYYMLRGGQYVHNSRCIRLDGNKVPPNVLRETRWHESVLESVFNTIADFASGMAGMAQALHEYSVTTIGMTGLKNAIASGKSEAIVARAAAAHATMSMFRIMMHDAEGEKVERLAHTLNGMPDCIDRMLDRVANAADMPKAILFGNAIGKVSGADNDLKVFYDRAKYRQTTRMVPALERIVRLIFAARLGPFRGQEPDGWSIKPRPLWQMSETERADLYLKTAQADQIYVDMSALVAFEVRGSRFGDDDQQTGIQLDDEVTKALELDKVPEEPEPPDPSMLPTITAPPGLPAPASKPGMPMPKPKAEAEAEEPAPDA
jgi:hypothetical protein